MPEIRYITSLDDRGVVRGFKQIDSASTTMGSSMARVNEIATALGVTFGALQIAQSLKHSASEALRFQDVMANVDSVLDDGGITADELSQQVLRLGGNLGSSAELADALYEALGAGVEPARAVEFVAEAAKLAKGQLFEAGDATRLLAVIMNSYGLEAKDAAHLSDVFSKTIAAGVVRGEELANSLGTVVSTAALAKVPIEEVAAAVAVMTKGGINAAEATTALNQAILTFISPSKEAAKIAKEYGIELSASTLAQHGFKGALDLVKVATGGNIEVINQLFNNVRAGKAVMSLTGAQAEMFTDILDSMRSSVGVTDKAFEKNTGTISKQWEAAINSAQRHVDKFGLAMKEHVLPALVSVNRAFESGELPINGATLAVGAFGLALGGLAIAQTVSNLGKLNAALQLPFLLTSIQGLADLRAAVALAAGASGFGALTASVGTATTSLGLFKTAGLIGLAAGIGAIVGSLVNWVIEGTRVRGVMDDLARFVGTGIFSGQVTDDIDGTTQAIQRASQELSAYGVTIEQGSMTQGEYIAVLSQEMQSIQGLIRASQEAGQEQVKNNGITEVSTALTEEQQKAIDKLITSVVGDRDETVALAAALRQLEAANVPAVMITDKLGKTVTETAQALKDQGATIDPTIQKWAEFVVLQDKMDLAQQRVSDAVSGVNITFEQSVERARALQGTYDLLSVRLQEVTVHVDALTDAQARLLIEEDKLEAQIAAGNIPLRMRLERMSQVQGVYDTLVQSPPIPPIGVDPTIKQRQDDLAEFSGEVDETKDRINDLKKAARDIFRDLIKDGGGLGDIFKGVGLTAASDMFSTFTAELLEPLKEKWDELLEDWTDKIKDFAKELRSHIQDALKGIGIQGAVMIGGGAAIGGAVGGTRGAVAGGLAGGALNAAMSGNWIAAAIEGVAALGVALSGAIGAGRREANRFVNEVQNKFGGSVEQLFGALEQARGMGTLTKTEVTAARGELEALWKNFQAAAAEATHGVGEQATATIGPLMDGWRAWLDGLDAAALELERMAAMGEFTDKIYHAADGFEALEGALAQLIAEGVPTSQIIRFLGDDVTKMSEVMEGLGYAIPPNIQAIQHEIEATERMTKEMEAARAQEDAYRQAIESTMGKVLHAADGHRVLEESIQQLTAQGVPASQIVEFLGSDISTMGETMKKLGMEIPPGIAAMLAEAAAQEALTKQQKEAEAATKAYESAIASYEAKVLNAADGSRALEEALGNLVQQGVPTSQIVAFLGDDIRKMGETMRALGIDIPPNIAAMLQQAKAMEEQKKKAEEAAAALKAHTDAVAATVGKVTDAADNFVVLQEAIGQLESSGVPASEILHFLGSDIQSMAETFEALGLAIPPNIASLLAQSEAMHAQQVAAEEAAAAQRAHADAVDAVVGRMTGAAENWNVLQEGLQRLQEQGAPTSAIIEFLGGDLVNMAEQMQRLGVEIPPAVEEIYNLIQAQERLAEIESELATVNGQLNDALIRKMEHLESAMANSQSRVAEWASQVQSLDQEIREHGRRLEDATYWQQMYDDAIRDSAQNLEEITQRRRSLEEQIAAMTIQVERDRLQSIIDGAGGAEEIAAARAALEALERQVREQEMQDRVAQLETLRQELADTIIQQAAAEEAYANASVAAQELIEQTRTETQERITSAEAQRQSLLAMIAIEQDRIAVMQTEMEATQALMEALGITREDEYTALNRTIEVLLERKRSLESERDQLQAVAGAARTAQMSFQDLVAALGASSGAVAGAGGTGTGTGTGGNGDSSNVGGTGYTATQLQSILETTNAQLNEWRQYMSPETLAEAERLNAMARSALGLSGTGGTRGTTGSGGFMKGSGGSKSDSPFAGGIIEGEFSGMGKSPVGSKPNLDFDMVQWGNEAIERLVTLDGMRIDQQRPYEFYRSFGDPGGIPGVNFIEQRARASAEGDILGMLNAGWRPVRADGAFMDVLDPTDAIRLLGGRWQATGESVEELPEYATGIDQVRFRHIGVLDPGEAVLNRAAAEAWRRGQGQSQTITIHNDLNLHFDRGTSAADAQEIGRIVRQIVKDETTKVVADQFKTNKGGFTTTVKNLINAPAGRPLIHK